MDTFDDIYDRGAGEKLDRELSRASAPAQPATREQMLRLLPEFPSGIELPGMQAGMIELARVRLDYAAARQALNAAENRRSGARAEDAARGAAAFRTGSDAVGPSAVQSLEAEIVGLMARRDAGAAAVWTCEEELFTTIAAHKAEYLATLGAAVEADRKAALAALDDFAASRARLLGVLNVQSWLSGTRKWRIAFGELRGIGAPAPRHEDVVESLRRELTWS
jgi:hypothetical protein